MCHVESGSDIYYQRLDDLCSFAKLLLDIESISLMNYCIDLDCEGPEAQYMSKCPSLGILT